MAVGAQQCCTSALSPIHKQQQWHRKSTVQTAPALQAHTTKVLHKAIKELGSTVVTQPQGTTEGWRGKLTLQWLLGSSGRLWAWGAPWAASRI